MKLPVWKVRSKVDAWRLNHYHIAKHFADDMLAQMKDEDVVKAVNDTKPPIPERAELRRMMLAYITPHYQLIADERKRQDTSMSKEAAKGIVEAFEAGHFSGDNAWAWPRISQKYKKIVRRAQS